METNIYVEKALEELKPLFQELFDHKHTKEYINETFTLSESKTTKEIIKKIRDRVNFFIDFDSLEPVQDFLDNGGVLEISTRRNCSPKE